jgi:dipeptidyl aminopeptidase/acylaminoacyl peptidase
MKRTAQWAAALAMLAAVHTVVILGVTGVPKPPTIVAEGVQRVGWGPLFESVRQRLDTRASSRLLGWMPDGSGMLSVHQRWLFDARLHSLSAPGARPRFLPAVPRNASVHTDPGRPYVVLGIDRNGDEQYALYRWDLGRSRREPLTPADERAAFGAFEPDGHRIAYVSTRRNGRDADVYTMDPRDPSTDHLVLQREGLWRVAAWSPNDDRLLLARAATNLDVELFTLDLATGEVEPVPAPEGPARIVAPQWSRDGRSLYYASDRVAEFGHLRRLDLASGEEVVLSGRIPWDVESIQQSGDGRLLLIGVNEDGRTRYYTGDDQARALTPLDLFSSGQVELKLHPTERVVAVNHVDERGHVRGYLYDLASGELELWVGGSPRERELPAPQLVRYPTFDEVDGSRRMIPAFVYPGLGSGPRPVVIDIHGGPEAQARLRSSHGRYQRDGITVITPNVRGSTGYGRTYTRLDDWKLREDAVRDIGALLDWVGEQPELDGDRVVVTGGSYGGYMVLASLVHYSPRIRCGIDVVGLSNFVTFLENTAEYRKDIRRAEYGDERIPEMRAFLEAISPLNNAERITSRLMVVQGTNDPRVPVTESLQIVERVRRNGFDVPYIEGKNEGHGFRQPWNALWAGLAQQEFIRSCLIGR